MQHSDMESSRLEIGLVTLSIFILLLQLGLIMWYATRRRVNIDELAALGHGGIPENPCLWRDVFPDQQDHEPILAVEGLTDTPSFVEQVRKKSGSMAGAVQHELNDIRRRLSATGMPRRSSRPKQDLETGMMVDGVAASGLDQARGDSRGTARRRSSRTAEDPKQVHFSNNNSRRESSWLINLEQNPEDVVKPRPRAPSER